MKAASHDGSHLKKKDVDRHRRSLKGGPFSPPCFSSSCHVMDHHHKDGRIGRGIEQERRNWKIHLSTMANDIQLGSEPNRFSATLESPLLLAWYIDPSLNHVPETSDDTKSRAKYLKLFLKTSLVYYRVLLALNFCSHNLCNKRA